MIKKYFLSIKIYLLIFLQKKGCKKVKIILI